VIWQCNHKYDGDTPCRTPHLDENTIKAHFVTAVNTLLADTDEILENFKLMRTTVFDTTVLEKGLAELQNEIEVVSGLIEQAISENARFTLDQDKYQESYNGLVARFEQAKARHEAVTEEIKDKGFRLSRMKAFLNTLRKQDGLLTEFDEKLWRSLLDYMTVYGKDKMRFLFKDGTEIQI